MRKWNLAASVDGVNIDFETTIESETEPGYWECHDLAAANGCEFFTVTEITSDEAEEGAA